MAGSDSRFNADAFRDAIHFAMEMGRPDIETFGEFIWKPVRTNTPGADAAGNAYNWGSSPTTEETFDSVTIPIAFEFVSKGGDTQDTRLGQFDVSRAIITILDDDYEDLLVYDGVLPDQVRFDESVYDIQFWPPPVGLFDVNVHSVHVQAVDEA